ncbi:unnamed protein product [Symbiodinium necroappetens]|uniref:Uncharacterized protein n=1 Tax=Symbiodinium necroappetens TaxID=1628268 RepID=A0A812YX06_9DINO|nr:unnamed protein product [Symbiodinium necroappetens]
MGKTTKAAAKAKVLVKKEPGTSAAEDKKDLCNFLTQVKGSDQPDKVAVYKHYTSLGRYDKQKKELLALWKNDKSCKWYGSWSKRVTFTEKEEAEGRTGFGTRFQVASLLEMPADSKEFLAVEKSLVLMDGMADDQWDEKDPTQVAFAKAKLKRFHLAKIAVTFGKTTTDKTWSESVEANRQTGKASGEQLSSVLDIVGRTGGSSEAGSSSQGAEVKTHEDLRFEKYQNQVAVLSTSKSIFFAFKLGIIFFAYIYIPGSFLYIGLRYRGAGPRQARGCCCSPPPSFGSRPRQQGCGYEDVPCRAAGLP